ncbi:MAG TPA: hypothetical protein GXZ28_04125 [Clostridiales bacterium]|nr:hypothetical protein [Clostridiales bacterium]
MGDNKKQKKNSKILGTLLIFLLGALFLGAGKARANTEDSLYFANEWVEEGVPLVVQGAPENSLFHWTITGPRGDKEEFTTEENTYIPRAKDKEKLITVRVDGMENPLTSIYFSSLPVIYINSNKGGYYDVDEEYRAATMVMQGNESYRNKEQLVSCNIEIRLRGNSTKWRDKRPFNIKLENKEDLLGMGANKRWALLANDIDHTLMRNKILYDFSGAIGMDTYMESENVILIFNNQYYGVYQLSENVRIHPTRVDIFDWEEAAEDAAEAIVSEAIAKGLISEEERFTKESDIEDSLCWNFQWITEPYLFTYDIDKDGSEESYTITDYVILPSATGGVLLEADFYSFWEKIPSKLITAYSQPYYFKTPEMAFSNQSLFEYIKKYLQSFEYALHSTDFTYHENDIHYKAENRLGGNENPGYEISDFSASEFDGRHYASLFDMESLVQNFLVCELSMNWDSMKNSVFIYKDVDDLFHFGPVWDFDWAFGNINMFNIYTWYPESWHTTEKDFTVEQYYQTVQWNRFLIRDPYFLVKAYEKYHEIRPTVIEELIKEEGFIDSYVSHIREAALANDKRWDYSYGLYNSVGFDESVNNLKKFLSLRINWLDKQFESLDSFVSSLGYYKASDDLVVKEIDTKSKDGYALITAEVKDPNIASLVFQVNGIHMFTEEVTSGKALAQIPSTVLYSDSSLLNVVHLMAVDSNGEYIIDSKEEGNYYNAKSNYQVFTSNIGSANPYPKYEDFLNEVENNQNVNQSEGFSNSSGDSKQAVENQDNKEQDLEANSEGKSEGKSEGLKMDYLLMIVLFLVFILVLIGFGVKMKMEKKQK